MPLFPLFLFLFVFVKKLFECVCGSGEFLFQLHRKGIFSKFDFISRPSEATFLAIILLSRFSFPITSFTFPASFLSKPRISLTFLGAFNDAHFVLLSSVSPLSLSSPFSFVFLFWVLFNPRTLFEALEILGEIYTYTSVFMANSAGINHLSQPCIYGVSVSSNAERKSRFMKWLSKIFKGSGGSARAPTTGGRNSQFLEDENMVWGAPSTSVDDRRRGQKDREELDRAVALPLAEDLKEPGAGYKCRTDNDEDTGRGHQDSLHRPYPTCVPSYPPHDLIPHHPRVYRLCSGCNREIGYGNYLGCMGTFFHPECFCCRSCGYPITEHEFSLSGRDPYHKTCFKELTHPKCDVCHQFIPTNAAGLIEYRCHPFWSQKYCPSHEHDYTARCCSCERLESWNTRYIALGDGRSLCLECMESAIMDTGDCQPLYHSIRDYYEGMNMRIDQQIPMLLVQREALNEAIVGEKNGFHHMPETRGLCLSEEQTVTTILRRPRIGGHRLVGMRTQPQKLTRRCEVTAILVLYGLPRLLTGAILAHELMHGWLRLKGYRNLSPEVEEGICQVLSYMWLESEVMPGFRSMPSTSTASSSSASHSSSKKGRTSGVEKKLGEFFLHQIANDASPAYGGGFRTANAAVNKYGLRRTLDHISFTGSFPI